MTIEDSLVSSVHPDDPAIAISGAAVALPPTNVAAYRCAQNTCMFGDPHGW